MTPPCARCGGSLWPVNGFRRRYAACLACGHVAGSRRRELHDEIAAEAHPGAESSLPAYVERAIAALVEG